MLGYYTNHGGSKAAWRRRTLCLLHGLAGKVAVGPVADADELSGRRPKSQPRDPAPTRSRKPAVLRICVRVCRILAFVLSALGDGQLIPADFIPHRDRKKERSIYLLGTTEITTAN